MTTKAKLRKWIHDRLLVPPAPVQLRIFRVGAIEDNGRENVVRIHIARISPDIGDQVGDEASRLASEIWPLVEQAADMYEGELPSKFTCHSYHKGESKKLARGVFYGWRLQRGDLVRADSAGPTEPPTARGQQQQQMRHNEALVKLIVEMHQSTTTHNRIVMESQAEEIEDLRAQARSRWDLEREMADDKVRREIIGAEFVGEEERKTMAYKKLVEVALPVLGPLISKLLKVAPPSSSSSAPPTSPAPSSSAPEPSSSAPAPASTISRDDRAELRRMISDLPEEAADVLMKSLKPADKNELLRIAGMDL